MKRTACTKNQLALAVDKNGKSQMKGLIVRMLITATFWLSAGTLLLHGETKTASSAEGDAKEITWSFKRLPATMNMKITNKQEVSKATAYFPPGYTLDKKWPLVVLINGSEGGAGKDTSFARSVVGDQDFICVDMPSYKEHVEPLKDDDSNRWMPRQYIAPTEGAYIWKSYRVMLEKIFSEIPNIDRNKTFFGGFSNGANTTAALLSCPESASEFLTYFRHLILVEGADELRPAVPLTGVPFLVLRGSDSGNLLQEPKNTLASAHADWEEFVMQGVAHEFNNSGKTKVKEWIYQQLKKP